MLCPSLKKLFAFLITAIICSITGCSNSDYVKSTECDDSIDSESIKIDYLPLDDSEYPYAGIPRIVIETENNRQIRDRETEIPAKLQIWGEHSPESEIMELTIRGRGNSSWTSMPKKSYKIEFTNKQSIFGMPKDRDWALIANYADKTLIRNFIAYNLSASLEAYYTPRCRFIELYLNKEYIGVYLLTETIKTSTNRINVSSPNFFLVEIDEKYRKDEQIVFSNIISSDPNGKPFRIHQPKNASKDEMSYIEGHITNFEKFLTTIASNKQNNIEQWIDIDEFVKNYWMQEFTKDPDAFYTSSFFSLQQNNTIKMGPIWDMDLSFGNFHNESLNNHHYWYLRNLDWNKYIFQDSLIIKKSNDFWKNNRNKFFISLEIIDSTYALLHHAARNNFKRWPILQSTANKYHHRAYKNYEESIEDLKDWISERLNWIDSQIH